MFRTNLAVRHQEHGIIHCITEYSRYNRAGASYYLQSIRCNRTSASEKTKGSINKISSASDVVKWAADSCNGICGSCICIQLVLVTTWEIIVTAISLHEVTGEEKLDSWERRSEARDNKYDSPESQFWWLTIQVIRVLLSETRQVIGVMKQHKWHWNIYTAYKGKDLPITCHNGA